MNIVLEFGLNLLVIALLGATVFYCWLLSKRIQVLQDSRGEMAELLRHFDASTIKARESMVALQNASKHISENIRSQLSQGHDLQASLQTVLEQADSAANEVEASLAIARQREKIVEQPPQMHTASQPTQKMRPKSPQRNTASLPSDPSNAHITAAEIEATLKDKNRSVASLQTLVEKVAARHKTANLSDAASTPRPNRSRSEAELMQLMKTKVRV